MSPRLHALQGRGATPCPCCGHTLDCHTEGECSRCIAHVQDLGYESAAIYQRTDHHAPMKLCASPKHEAGRLVCPDGGGKCEPEGCDRAEWCPGPVPLPPSGGR